MIRVAAAALAVIAAALYLLVFRDPSGGLAEFRHEAAPAFTVLYDDALLDVLEGPDMLTLRGERKGLEATLRVAPLALPEYEGDVAGLLPVLAENRARSLGLGDLRVIADKRARIHGAPGYEYGVEDPAGTRTTLVVLLPPDEAAPREGVLLRYDRRQSPERDRGGGRRVALAMQDALRSFQFGDERY